MWQNAPTQETNKLTFEGEKREAQQPRSGGGGYQLLKVAALRCNSLAAPVPAKLPAVTTRNRYSRASLVLEDSFIDAIRRRIPLQQRNADRMKPGGG
jgi:hypothetical protein